jgi:hypothetical protein
MKSTELRIGNYVNNKGRFDIVTCLEYVTNEDFINVRGQYYECFIPEPIPLTEEWLLKMGGVKRPSNFYFIKRLKFDINTGGVVRFIFDGKCTYLDYVHQLQNLYFALTGEEFTTHHE